MNGRWVAGVDGCRAGWVVVLGSVYTAQHCAYVVPHFQAVVALGQELGVIAVDVPIGLLSTAKKGGRDCEVRARALLGQRGSSVFSSPTRAALAVFRRGGTYQQVAAANRGGNATAPGLSRQTYGIMSKIAEVDALLIGNPALRNIVYEVHPELCFREANGGTPMTASKKTRSRHHVQNRRSGRVAHWQPGPSEHRVRGSSRAVLQGGERRNTDDRVQEDP